MNQEEALYRPDQIIRDAAKHGELVVFVGAGASMLCGSPDWRGFANQVVGTLETAEILSFLEAEQLRGLGDPRRTLSIAMALAKEQRFNINFDSILHPKEPEALGAELYDLLSDLRPVFVTTNYDKWLDEAGPGDLTTEISARSEIEPIKGPKKRPKYYLPEHLTSDRLAERGAVVHLHGSYTDQKSMIVSLRDYVEHYADPRVQNFLSAMFKNYTVLFIGYGLAELEVLEFIIRSNESLKTSSVEPRHYILYACRSTETVQTEFVERFFREQCGVRVVPYCIDEKGFKELIKVIKAWSSELEVRDPTILDLQAHLDRYVAIPNPSAINKDAAIRLVKKRPELTAYFLNSLKDAVWFTDLNKAGFFKAEHNPKVKIVENEQGTMYQAEGWPALSYLELIAPTVSSDQANCMADIIRRISSDAQQRRIDNWRTWWSLAAILSQLPVDIISVQDIEMIRPWLIGRFDANWLGQEFGAKLLPRLLDSTNPANWEKAMLLVEVLSMVRPQEKSS